MKPLTASDIRILVRLMTSKGYVVYDKPYQLNIVGIRSNSVKPNSFDDTIRVFFKDDSNKWIGYSMNATTDAGTYWLQNPMMPKGTALLKAGQYVDAYSIGQHRGQYTALVQSKDVTVIRDYNRNAILDFNNGKEDKGMFGINIHRASVSGNTTTVDKYSAGCQVIQNPKDFETLISLAKKHQSKYGNKFTYTLIDERALSRRKKMRAIVIGLSVLSLASIGYYISLKQRK